MSLTLFDPVGSLLRMSLASVLSERTRFSNHWKEAATPAGRSWWVLTTSERPIEESGSSSSPGWPTSTTEDAEHSGRRKPGKGSTLTVARTDWPTAGARDYKDSQDMAIVGPDGRDRLDQLPRLATHWPTPRTITGGKESAARKKELGRKDSGGGDLQAAVEDWPTPLAGLASSGQRSRGGKRKDEQLFGGPCMSFPRDPTTTQAGRECFAFVQTLPRRRLNPAFVEWLMGFPENWLDATGAPSSEVSEMLLSLPSGKSSAKQSTAPRPS